MQKPSAERFLSLDVLRGLAALAVVVWHWQHFFGAITDRSVQPFYAYLVPFYEHGELAVSLFFSLSGFIFYQLYAKKIADGGVPARSFAQLRFSRLYPLHFATLLLVLGFQTVYYRNHGAYFIYQANDWFHFLLQVCFASEWLPNSPGSFNGPIWSVSVEVLLYGAFYLACRRRLIHPLHLLLFSTVGSAIFAFSGNHTMAHGFLGFFLGGLCSWVYRELRARGPRVEKIAKIGLSAVIALALVAFACGLPGLFGEKFSHFLISWSMRLAVFPVSIVLIALAENDLRRVSAKFAWIGDMTYSSYLTHFPLQLGFVLAADALGITIDYRSGTTFLVYFALLMMISIAVFRGFEKPAQQWLRAKMSPGKQKSAPVSGLVAS